MHPAALLELATELLHQVLRFEHPADSVVSDFFRRQRQLGARERHTLAETTYAVLREKPLWQHLAQSGKGEMERRLVLLAWQGNAAFLRAALAPAEVAWLEQVQTIDRVALPERLRHNLPDWLAIPSRPDVKMRRRRSPQPGSMPGRRRIHLSACALRASRRCTSSTSSCAATSRCRTKAASCSRC